MSKTLSDFACAWEIEEEWPDGDIPEEFLDDAVVVKPEPKKPAGG